MTDITANTTQLPNGWAWAILQDCVEILDGKRVPINSKEREQRKVGKLVLFPYYGATGQVDLIDDFLFNEELVLLGEDGAPFLDPFKAKAFKIKGKSWVNNHAHVLRANSGLISNSYLCHYLNTFRYNGYVTGTTRLKLNQALMKKIPIPLAPYSEQVRIVSKVEELFSFLDAGVSSLYAIQTQLKRYRQSVLKCAFEGKLTVNWRNFNSEKTINKTLQLINQQGKARQQKRKLTDTESLPTIPLEWAWVNLDQISNLITDGVHNPPKRVEKGIPHLTAKNVVDWKLSDEDCTYITEKDFEKSCKRYCPMEDDIIVTCVGTIGRTAVVPRGLKFSADRNLAAIRLVQNIVRPKLLLFYLNTTFAQKVMKSSSGSTAQPHLYLADIRKFPVILLPLPEQDLIVEKINKYFTIIQTIETSIKINLKRSDYLRQSILSFAFSGRLVPQNTMDGSAEEMLERIKAERLSNKSKNNQLESSQYVK